MKAARFIGLVVAAMSIALALAVSAHAQSGDPDRGEAVYLQRCVGCHGDEGDGLGPGAERLNPPPRDFTVGDYKFRTTAPDDIVPNDSDIYRMIKDGMPGTAMASWGDVLSEQQMWDLVEYIKVFAGFDEEEPSEQVDYGTRVASSDESIEIGRKLFADACAECHGENGKGDGLKKLKDDNGARTWPRNLTKPWTFRASNDPEDIFTRVTVGIPGTQMPSFANPQSKKKLDIEQRWHVANYAASLAQAGKAVRPENTVVKANKVDGGVPNSADDARWLEAETTTFFLVPQIVARERFFTPSNDTLTVRALYGDEEIAILLEWDDRTKSIPGDPEAEKIADPNMAEDAVAVQLPQAIPEGTQKPYFGMGEAGRPVNLWGWRSGAKDQPESAWLVDGRGFDALEQRDAAAAGLTATGTYEKGTWRVVMTRPRSTGDPDRDLQFAEGKFIPIAFSAWDGSNGERDTKHTMTTWYWLLLKPAGSARPFVAALIVLLLAAGAEFWWWRSASRRPPEGAAS
jgi:DMSO reductase family type II enzyme heme b subunit